MEIVVAPSYAEMSLRAAEIVCAAIRAEPRLVLGLPTGATPVGMYRQLAAAYTAGQVDFGRVRTFNLDEYCGLGPQHPASYHSYMRENLCAHVNLSPQRTHIPNGIAPKPEAECDAYAKAIAEAGELDLAVLGIGQNGHVGFNEPDDSLQAEVHVAVLRPETRRLAYACWRNSAKNPFSSLAALPQRAITMGIGNDPAGRANPLTRKRREQGAGSECDRARPRYAVAAGLFSPTSPPRDAACGW